nr:hypothetical protein [Planctomycetota bacterium]
ITANALLTELADPFHCDRADPAGIESRDDEVRPELRREEIAIGQWAGPEGFWRAREAAEPGIH